MSREILIALGDGFPEKGVELFHQKIGISPIILQPIYALDDIHHTESFF